MTQALLILIFIAAAMSLVSYVYCWQDIKGGRPHIVSLRQITGIMDRNRLNRRFGIPETGYYYPLSPEQMQDLLRSRAWFFYGECTADAVCLLGVWLYMNGQGDSDFLWWFIALAGICQIINVGFSLWLVHKWREQIREEIENSDD